jgi:TPR repeat protein
MKQKNIKYTLLCVSIILFIAVFLGKKKIIEVVFRYYPHSIEELKSLALEEGDTMAYDELISAHINEGCEYENLIYSILMAHKHNYPPAYWEVYHSLITAPEAYGHTVDDKTKEIALEYLMKAAELNDSSAFSTLCFLYKKGELVPKDSVKSEYYYQKYKERQTYYIEKNKNAKK